MRKGLADIFIVISVALLAAASSVLVGKFFQPKVSLPPPIELPSPQPARFGPVYKPSELTLGAVTDTTGFNYPTSGYAFADNDIINSGDFNKILNWLGVRNSTDSISVAYNAFNPPVASATGTLPVNRGGTATTTYIYGVVIASSTNAFTTVSPGSNGNVLTSNGSAWTSAAGAAVAGTTTQIQYNEGGVLAATSTFTFTSSTQQLLLNDASSSVSIGRAYVGSSLNSTSSTFYYTGTVQSFDIPSNVTSVIMQVIGARGNSSAGTPGNGGSASGTLAVTPGTRYYFGVGGSDGFGGGAANRGGGRSWIGTASAFSTSTAIVVGAGGGGGGSAAGGSGAGGAGGGLTGTAGTAVQLCGGGGGGTQTAGGGGGGGSGGGASGAAGTEGNGGAGGGNGGGGGGGYFGGGGGGRDSGNNADCGGGGGSSFMISTMTSTSTNSGTNSTGDGQIRLVWPTSTTLYVNIASTSTFSLASAGHVTLGGFSPSVSSCGTNPTVQGTDTAGVISVGSGATTACTLTFSVAYPIAPVCVANASINSVAFVNSVSVSSVVWNFSASVESDKVYYLCIGL